MSDQLSQPECTDTAKVTVEDVKRISAQMVKVDESIQKMKTLLRVNVFIFLFLLAPRLVTGGEIKVDILEPLITAKAFDVIIMVGIVFTGMRIISNFSSLIEYLIFKYSIK